MKFNADTILTENGNISLGKLLLGFALLWLIIQCGVSLYGYAKLATLSLAFPYPIDYGEGPILDQTMRLIEGQTIYKNDFARPPYTITNYPPVYLLAQAPFAKLFGAAFWYGRGISFVAALLIAVLIALTLHTLTGDLLASLIGGIFFLVFPYVQYWSLLDRVDLLALALSWAGIFTAVRFADRRWVVPVTAAFFIAAAFTRQTYLLAGPATIFAWLLNKHQTRKALLLAGLVGGGSLALFLLFNGLTQGGFYLNIILANVNPYSIQNLNRIFIEFSTYSFYLLTLLFVFLIAERTGDHTRYWVLVLFYFLTAGLAALTVGKEGSSVNYMIELVAALCFGAGAGLSWLGRNPWLRGVLLIALAFQVAGLTDWGRNMYLPDITKRVAAQSAITRLYQQVRQTDGTVLADEFMGLLPLAGKQIYYQPFEYKMLKEGGLWDDTAFLESIRSQQFGLVLWYDPYDWPAVISRWPDDIRAAVRAAYQQVDTIDYTYVFRPKGQ